MVVGIDNISPGLSTSKETIGGMRAYMQDLLDFLPAQQKKWKFKLFTSDWSTRFRTSSSPNLETVILSGVPQNRFLRVAYEQFVLPRVMRQHSVGLWLGTHNVLPLRAPCKTVVVAQSLQYFTQASMYPFARRKYLQALVPYSMRRANCVIALSEVSRREIERRFRVPAERIHIVHHGLQSQIRTAGETEAQASSITEHPFVLGVSALYPYKNYERLMEAFARIAADFPQHQLVIVGADTWGQKQTDLKKHAAEVGIANRVIMAGRVSSETLALLYQQADVMAMVSLDETFGLTVLEAMHFGCPVVTSEKSSMAEVGAHAVELVDPYSVESIASGLKRVLANPDMRRRMAQEGKAEAARFTPERMARNLGNVLERVVAEPKREFSDASR